MIHDVIFDARTYDDGLWGQAFKELRIPEAIEEKPSMSTTLQFRQSKYAILAVFHATTIESYVREETERKICISAARAEWSRVRVRTCWSTQTTRAIIGNLGLASSISNSGAYNTTLEPVRTSARTRR